MHIMLHGLYLLVVVQCGTVINKLLSAL